MKPKEILAQARQLLQPPQAWSQDAFALDETDGRVHYTAKSACSFCIEGAVRRSAMLGNASDAQLNHALSLVRVVIQVPGNYPTIQGWNGRRSTTQQDVLAVLSKAIAAAP